MQNRKIQTIQLLSAERLKLYDEYEDSYDVSIGDFGDYFKEWNPKIDDLGDEIYKLLETHHAELPLELVLEELAKLGQSPSLIYDDNGHWSIATDGYQSAPLDNEPCDIESVFVITEKEWFNNISDALSNYFKENKE